MKLMQHMNMALAFKFLAALLLASQLSACVPVVIGGAAAGGSMAADRRTTGVYIEDQNIELKASQKISADLPDSAHLNVSSCKGTVLLTGEVADLSAKAKMESIAKAIESVTNINNELVVGPKSSLSSRANDAYITSKIRAQFISNNKFQANVVKVVTENSVVYLMGYVTQKEAESAVEIARNTHGVSKVVKVFEYMP